MEDVYEEVDNTQRSKISRSKSKWDVSFIRRDTFDNEQKRGVYIPDSFCAVCCRILYTEERCVMSETAEKDISEHLRKKSLTWPVLMYKDRSGKNISKLKRKDNGRIVVCASHKSSGKNSIAGIKEFVSGKFGIRR